MPKDSLIEEFGNMAVDDYSEMRVTIYHGELLVRNKETKAKVGKAREWVNINSVDFNVLNTGGENIPGQINSEGRYCEVYGDKGIEIDHIPSEESLRKKVFNGNVPQDVRDSAKSLKLKTNSQGKKVGFAEYMDIGRRALTSNPNVTIADIEKDTDLKNRFIKVEALSYAIAITGGEHHNFSATYHAGSVIRQSYSDRIDDGVTIPPPAPQQRSEFDRNNPEAAIYRDVKSILDNTALRRMNNLSKDLVANDNFPGSLGAYARHKNKLDALDRIGAYVKLYKDNIAFGTFDVSVPALKYSTKENMPAKWLRKNSKTGAYSVVNQDSINSTPIDGGVCFKPSGKSKTAGEKMDSMLLKRVRKIIM